MQRRSCSGDSSGRKRRSRRSFLARRRGEAVSGTACVTPAWPRQRSDAVGNGRGGEGKQQLVGKGGKRSLGGGRGGRRWRPYPPRGACSGVAGEVVRRRRPCCGLRPRNRAGGRETAARGQLGWLGWVRWAGPGGFGPGRGLLSLSPLSFSFFCFSFSSSFCIFLLATNDFAKLCHWLKQFQRIIVQCHKKNGEAFEKG